MPESSDTHRPESPAGTGGSQDGAALAGRMWTRLTWAGTLSNGLGGLIVFVVLLLLIPVTPTPDRYGPLIALNAVVGVVYMAVTLPLGRYWTRRIVFRPLSEWLRSGRPATDAERRLALHYPFYFARNSAVFWGLAAALFGALNTPGSETLGCVVTTTIALGGVSTCALGYLLVERIVRPMTLRALAGGAPPPLRIPGVAARLTMAWALATGVPLLGVVAVGVAYLAGADVDAGSALVVALFLTVLALLVGWFALIVAARSVAEPVGAVRRALERVEEGEFDARVSVDDGSEVGQLQAGFNRMASGLAERERLRDLFGRHVGRDVARAALEAEVRLGGEVREVGVLFVDVVGSTSLARARPPTEVVALLNGFFRIVVEVTAAHGGTVNKFEGDGALSVFGAPVRTSDPAGRALRAGRELHARLNRELPGLAAGIGVSAGETVAGNVGAEERFEYTVIGDPVNEAARLCDLAKRRPTPLLASEAAILRAAGEERERWSLGEGVTLRGRDAETRLATVAA